MRTHKTPNFDEDMGSPPGHGVITLPLFANGIKEESDMNHSVVSLDIAKNIFYLYGSEVDNQVIRKELKRAGLLTFFANYPVSTISIGTMGQP